MNRLVRMAMFAVAVSVAFTAASAGWAAEKTAKLTPVRICGGVAQHVGLAVLGGENASRRETQSCRKSYARDAGAVRLLKNDKKYALEVLIKKNYVELGKERER